MAQLSAIPGSTASPQSSYCHQDRLLNMHRRCALLSTVLHCTQFLQTGACCNALCIHRSLVPLTRLIMWGGEKKKDVHRATEHYGGLSPAISNYKNCKLKREFGCSGGTMQLKL